MARMKAGDLAVLLGALPPDADVVVLEVDWDENADNWYALYDEVYLDEENNEVTLVRADRVRTEEF